MPKILFVAAHRPNRSPSQRFRFEQYFDFLQQNGYECDLSYLISSNDDQVFYLPGNLLKKANLFAKSVIKRFTDLRAAKNYDIVFVQREAFMTGSVFFEKQLAKRAKFIFDFDDAIWLLDVSDANKKLGWLKNPQKTSKLISMADMVIAGNNYLKNYALPYNKNTIVIPTTVDTDYHVPHKKTETSEVCIGWTGSLTTIKHFQTSIPFLKKIKDKYTDKIYFKVIGDDTYRNAELNIKGVAWNAETEISDMTEIDIGIMPLPNDEWVKGKCGLKGLTYMSMEIPAVMSPVGVNTEIIQDGANGYLANTEDEWFEKLSLLIESKEIRDKIGKAGRQTVVEKYSVESQKNTYLNCFNQLLKS